MARKKALVIGGLGVIGRNLINHMSAEDDWDIVAVSRRAPDEEMAAKAEFISCDLLDMAAAEAAAAWADDAKQAIDSKGVAQAAKDVADEAKQRVSDSAGKFEAAYDEARGAGKSPLEAAGDAYNAVDRNED